MRDSDGNITHLLTCADGVLAQGGICQAFGKASHDPAAGASTAATFNEKLQADFLFLAVKEE